MLIDSASEEAKQVTVRTTEAGARTIIHLSVRAATWSAEAGVSGAHRLRDAARKALYEQRTTGKITVRDFGRTITGNREVVDITDQAVARELEKTLKRYGVTFAIEPGGDGTRTFHVQGKDISVVEHALSVASERIDQKIARNATRRHNAEKIEERVANKTQQRQQRERKQSRSKQQDVDTPAPLRRRSQSRTDRPARHDKETR